MCLGFISDMKKSGYVCFPCWKEDGCNRPYSRSYDLIAHMVNVHGKFTDSAINNTAYRTDGSDVRDATAEEKLRYLDANKHKRKKATSTVNSTETSKSDTAVGAEIPTKPFPIPFPGEWRARDLSSGDGPRSDSKSTGRERADRKDGRGSSGKSSDRGSSRRDESQKSERRARATEKEGGNDND